MRIIVQGSNDSNFHLLLQKMRSKRVEILHENPKKKFFCVKIMPAETTLLYELLELGAEIKRDIKNDLD